MKEITKERVRQVLTAGGKGQEVLDGGRNGHSVFTGRLIEILEAAGDYITANEIQAIIKEKVYGDALGRGLNQMPDFGRLSGSGDFVFVPFNPDKLSDLAVVSAARQKELDILKQLEKEAADFKEKEQAEIAKRESELVMLDKQIAEMKGRLGRGSVSSKDSLDAILAMAEQKEVQGKNLEQLRKQREVEDKKRQEEIERLWKTRIIKITADLSKYEKVASNKYAQDIKGFAWDSLVASYPEAKTVARYDAAAFAEKLDILVFTDPKTGLMRTVNSNIAGKGMYWNDAMKWANNLNYGGYSDWRLPTKEELREVSKLVGRLSSERLNVNVFNAVWSAGYWSSTSADSGSAWYVCVDGGFVSNSSKTAATGYVWPVRSGQQ